MATAEVGSDPVDDRGPQRWLIMSDDDLDTIAEEMPASFANPPDAHQVLGRMRFPRQRFPAFADPQSSWFRVFQDLRSGVMPDPYRRLLVAALHVYPYHPVLRPIAERYHIVAAQEVRAELPPDTEPEGETASAPDPPVAAPATEPPPQTCHVIIRADDEQERGRAGEVFAGLGLEPVEVWATATAVSFRVNATDHQALEQQLERDADDVAWTVVRPGQEDYLLQNLIVQGPDLRRFRVRDVPAQESIRNLASEVIEGHYPRPTGGRTVPIVVDHVRDGQPQRLDPDNTFDQAQVRDGDTVRVGYQTNAGSVNPDDHEAALYRARNQIESFARSHPGFRARANSAQLPTEYELKFRQRSLGPGERAGDDPVRIDDHVVLLQLGPDFPRTPPKLWWESPIFHPNVAPNDEQARIRRPHIAGLVCLGILAESWQPSWDFGDLCQMVIDMAAFRSYGLWEEIGREPDGTPIVRGDFYDKVAADWVQEHQKEIEDLGGVVKTVQRPKKVRYPHVIEVVDGSESDGTHR